MYNDESPGAGNASNNPGAPFSAGYAVSYGGCWFGRTPMHENGHNEGAVQAGAPDSTGTGGHCDEDWDVMCYLDGGNIRQDYPQPCSIAAGTLHFDCGWDSYFDSAPEPGEYLATHWNIGSSANRFIRFGGPSADFSSSCVLLHCTFTDHSSAPTGISSRTWNFGDGSTLTSTATTVTHDYLAVGGYPVTLTVVDGGGASSSTTRAVALNDAFANAQQLTGVAQTVTGGNLGATKEAGEPNHAGNAGGASVWYRWTPAVPGPTTIDTCGADFDTTLGVYTGSSVGALTQVAASDDNAAVCGTNAAQSAATFTAHAGTAYRIAVDGWDGASGSIALRLSETVDTTGPVATITGEPDDFGANPSFSFGAGEPATFECRLDGAPFAPCVSPQSYSGLADGPHVFSVRAIDAVGNAGAPVDRSFTVDSSAPETTIDSGPSKVKAGRSATFTFSSSEPGSSFECRLDSGRSGPCASPATIPRPRPGVHTFQVAAVDQAGHVDRTPATRTFKVKKRRRR
jgi:PKD repeat protein